MDKPIQINFRKIFKIHKPGEVNDSAIITYLKKEIDYWYDQKLQYEYCIRIDLWLFVIYFSWLGKFKDMN